MAKKKKTQSKAAKVARRSRSKGSGFEKTVARMFGLWWCNDKDAFWKNTGSGGRIHKVATPYSGDICPVKNVGSFPLHVECKKDESWSFEGYLKGIKSEALVRHMRQCFRDSKTAKRYGVLIISRNRDDVFVMLPYGRWKSAFKFTDKFPLICLQHPFAPRYIAMTWAQFSTIFSKKDVLLWIKGNKEL